MIFFLRTFVCFLVLATAPLASFSQCQPDSTNFEFFNPPPDELPCVIRNTPYDMVVQFFCPPEVAGITIDSIHIYSIDQLPAGLTYSGVPSDGKVKAWDHACLQISGTTSVTPGTYTLQSNGMAYTSIGTFPFNSLSNSGLLPPWELRIVEQAADCNATDIQQIAASAPFPYRWLNSSRQFIPNTDFSFASQPIQLQLVDALGRECFRLQQFGPESFALPQQLPGGQYILLLQHAGASYSLRISF